MNHSGASLHSTTCQPNIGTVRSSALPLRLRTYINQALATSICLYAAWRLRAEAVGYRQHDFRTPDATASYKLAASSPHESLAMIRPSRHSLCEALPPTRTSGMPIGVRSLLPREEIPSGLSVLRRSLYRHFERRKRPRRRRMGSSPTKSRIDAH
jgi:hypothetical protein